MSWAANGEGIAPGQVTACPVRVRLEVMPDGAITLIPGLPHRRDQRLDWLHAWLADSFGAQAVRVVLPGRDKDSSAGARRPWDASGTALMQDESREIVGFGKYRKFG